ncbi:MAG: hypothetical protein BJ554DRAFT_6068, partial [Olpidium bornovanus]
TGSTKGLGLLGQHIGGGKIRAAVVDTRTRAKPGLKTPKAWATSAGSGLSSTTGGVVTSLAFTPVQGIELSNPEAAKEKVREANERWFGSGGWKAGKLSGQKKAEE